MARDIRNNANGYNDRCNYYKRIKGTQEHEEAPAGRFRSMVVTPLAKAPTIINGKAKGEHIEVTIKTVDYIKDLTADDLVEYLGIKYRVDNIIVNPIPSSNKFSKKPKTETTIILVR